MPMEELNVYRLACSLADDLWDIVVPWDTLAKRVVGEQLLRACDSIAANLVEGDARYSGPDSVRFFRIARASAREVRHWLRRAAQRRLISAELAADADDRIVEIGKAINGLIEYRLSKLPSGQVKETAALYVIDEHLPADPLSGPTPNT
jgi:four helix bundle protein